MISPESMSRKRTRLEDQLSDIQYIDCNTPENVYATISTTAVIHTLPEPLKTCDSYQPKNKSPRNSASDCENKRQSLNLERGSDAKPANTIPKSMTDTRLLVLSTPQSPIYRPLGESSASTTPDSPKTNSYENVAVAPKSPTYENVLTTISITYRATPGNGDPIYEDVRVNPERAVVPGTGDASLPAQEASQPRPKSMSALEDERERDAPVFRPNSSAGALCDGSEESVTSDKRKSSETESPDGSVYQQVKYFRRSVHEINALLELEAEKPTTDGENNNNNDNNCDSLEDRHVEANGEELCDSLEEEKVCVADLKSVFEPKVYDRESLPPCLRARNLKQQTKTRSLDEEEFRKECGASQQTRRKSMDESIANKLSVAPKALNQPKEVPPDDGKLEDLHLSHGGAETTVIPPSLSEQLRRERIEKYKEARRKFLQDKYRSESFKEDKDVLLSRLKVFKKNCDGSEEVQSRLEDLSLRRTRRSREGESDGEIVTSAAKGEPDLSNRFRESFRTKAAIFEQRKDDDGDAVEDFIRERRRDEDWGTRGERRRHTYDSRERETETERVRRISLENKSPRWVFAGREGGW